MSIEKAVRAAYEAMYLFQYGDWYLDEPWQEKVGWSEDQLQVGIEAALEVLKEDELVLTEEIEAATKPTKWWRALDADGSLLAETSTPSDFATLDLINRPGVRFERLYEVTLSEWREE